MTPIVPIRKQETKYFGNEPVHGFWLELPPVAASAGNQDNNYMNRLKTCLESAPENGVICVFSEELSGKILCESLAKARDNGSRIYILTNSYHDEMKNLEGCLIRYGGGKRIGSFILINPNSNTPSGCLFTGRFADGSINSSANLLLDLDSNQVSALFRYFCYQFWNKAEKERIGREEHNTASAPLDIYPPVGDSCDLGYLKSVWGKAAENALITTSLLAESPYIKFSSFSYSIIVSLFSGIDDALVRSLKQKQNEIYVHDDVSLINSIKTPDGTWLIPKIDAAHEEEVYALSLTANQSEILDGHINTILQGKVQYQYYESDIRVNVSGKTIFHLGGSISEKYTIKAESRIQPAPVKPSELLPKDEFEKLKPELTDDGRSVLITYEWTNIPFTLPSGSKKHTLYQDWENAEKSINAGIDRIRENILENEKGGNKLSKLIERFFLGKKQKFSEYRNDLDELQKIKYGAINRQELQEKIEKINEIRSAVEKDSGEILEENRKAHLKEQIEAKKKEKEKLEVELGDKQKELQKIEEAVKIQSDSLKELEKQGKVKEEEVKDARKKTDALNVEKIKNDINSLESQIKKIADNEESSAAQLKEKENLEAKLDEKRQVLQKTEEDIKIQADNLKELEKQGEEKKGEIKEARKKSEDLNVEENKIKNEIEGLKREIKRNNDSIENFNEQLKNPAKEPPKKGSVLSGLQGGGKKPNQSGQTGELPVPQFPQLPSVGDLYKHNEQDYLAITDWEDYDQGKAEAGRLKAKLCAKGENNG